MINWKKERCSSDKNYCGYCIGSPPSANCDGGCFNNLENRLDHCKSMIEIIPTIILDLEKRRADFIKEALILDSK